MEPGPNAAALSNLFQHAKLTQLSSDDRQHGLLLDLQPLAQHLTQLRVGHNYDNLPAFISAVGALPQLQLPRTAVRGQGQLVELLAATQLTSPLVLGNLLVGHPFVSIPKVSAAVLNLTLACNVPVKIRVLQLNMIDSPGEPADPGPPPTAPAIGQQRAKLQQLVTVLQELQSIDQLAISNMKEL
ncbi:hypothetical protein HaLaN_09543 [Haematococcus lacustris]|uniref:Uncharacterized protein n=1 Tax=Haematococcus lacustris TaxID=44745 RepID=A0A699Z2C0_HAELA|nr:hypothetical protein HaLaN_09543 [Haematococcus lacustris]